MRILKDKIFARFARRQKLSDSALIEAVNRAESGMVDADLGGGVIKQRVARANEGRSGGYRTIVFFRQGERAFFVFGFAKNTLGNISDEDLKIFRRTAQVTLSLTDDQIATLLERESLIEVKYDEEENDSADI